VDDLARRLIEASELRGDFVLSSGRRSSVYFDKFRFLTRPDLLRELAQRVVAMLAPGTELVAAPEGAAMLLAAAVALEADLPIAVVRKEPKPYGTRALLEGAPPPGTVATLVEDVSTTGHQVRRAAAALQDAGVRVARIVLAIDRGGAAPLREAGFEVLAVVELAPTEGASP
jgi:orotate phosphoribosyltransferase